MRNRKIKIPQYLVRGKHRDFHVLVFPRLKHAWAYYCGDDFLYDYAVDTDIVGCKWLRYAMAALIAAPDKIVYFPIRTPGGFHLRSSRTAISAERMDQAPPAANPFPSDSTICLAL